MVISKYNAKWIEMVEQKKMKGILNVKSENKLMICVCQMETDVYKIRKFQGI